MLWRYFELRTYISTKKKKKEEEEKKQNTKSHRNTYFIGWIKTLYRFKTQIFCKMGKKEEGKKY